MMCHVEISCCVPSLSTLLPRTCSDKYHIIAPPIDSQTQLISVILAFFGVCQPHECRLSRLVANGVTMEDSRGTGQHSCGCCFNYLRPVNTAAEKIFSQARWAYYAPQPHTPGLWFTMTLINKVVREETVEVCGCAHAWKYDCVCGYVWNHMLNMHIS